MLTFLKMAGKSPKRERSGSPSKSRSKKKSKATVGTSHGDHFEFGGVVGAIGIPIVLVGTILLLYFGAKDKDCVLSLETLFNGKIFKCMPKRISDSTKGELLKLLFPSMVRTS